MLHSMDPKKLNKKEGPSKDAPITPKREKEIVTRGTPGGGIWVEKGMGVVHGRHAGLGKWRDRRQGQ